MDQKNLSLLYLRDAATEMAHLQEHIDYKIEHKEQLDWLYHSRRLDYIATLLERARELAFDVGRKA